MVPEDDDGQEYEYGDLEAHAMDANTADYSIHQFIAPDEARDPMGSDDTEEDAAHNDAARSKILSRETFDSEDVPSPDNFLQKSRKTHRRMMPGTTTMMETSSSMVISRHMQWMPTLLIIPSTSSLLQMRPVTPWVAMTLSKTQLTMMLPEIGRAHV